MTKNIIGESCSSVYGEKSLSSSFFIIHNARLFYVSMAFISGFCFLLSSVCTLNKFVECDVVDLSSIFIQSILSDRSIRSRRATKICIVVGRARTFRVNSRYAHHGHCADCLCGLSARSVATLY